MFRLLVSLFILVFLSLCIQVHCAIIHVKTDGSNGDGLTWQTAKTTISAGLEAAVSGDQVWVSRGTYTERITLKDGVALYGGFAGTESNLNQRPAFPRPAADPNESIIDGGGSGSVVSASGVTATTRIDGFTIQNGSSSGINCYSSYLVIENNIIRANSSLYGAGIYCNFGSPSIINNIITGNTSVCCGGGIHCYHSNPLISGNLIKQNISYSSGGGIYCKNSSPVISGNMVVANSANDGGGGLYCESSDSTSVIVTGNTFTANTSGNHAGGIYFKSSSLVISGNIIAHNSKEIESLGGSCTLKNNCVYNQNGKYYTYININAGSTDILVDPLFVNREGEDYHLAPGSPCIDAGCNDAQALPTTDIDGEDRIYNNIVDIGADEYWPTETVPLSAAKSSPDGSYIAGMNGVVTAVFSNHFYIESTNRCTGIRVEKTDHGFEPDMKVFITGYVRTNSDEERYIDASTAVRDGTDTYIIYPLGLNNRSIGGQSIGEPPLGQIGVSGGVGLNNIGLLIKTWGTVKSVGDGYFIIDDGSVPEGLKIYGSIPVTASENPIGKIVSVVGISSCEKPDDVIIPVVRTRDTDDVVILK